MNKVLSFLALLPLLLSCGTTSILTTPVWEPEYKKVDGVVSPKLKKFLKSNISPKVVLRVPNVASTITQSDTTANVDYSTFYGRVERQLVQEGFVVRDRALLQSLVNNGLVDYASIGKKIDTDLIIEITNISFNKEMQKAHHFLDSSNTKHYARHAVENQIVSVEARIIQVKTGEVGSILTLRTTFWDLLARKNMMYQGDNWLPDDVYDPMLGHYSFNGRGDWNKIGIIEKSADELTKNLLNRLRGDI